MKKLVSVLLITALIISSMAVLAFAEDTVSGTCGRKTSWVFNRTTGELVISGDGPMESQHMDHFYWTPGFIYYVPWEGLDIKTVTINEGVTNIAADAFYNCTNLISVTIPESVTTIGSDAFCNCEKLMSISIPDGVTSIEGGAFASSENLVKVIVGNGVKSIGSKAFSGCYSLSKLTLGSSVESIGDYAFSGCKALKKVTIPASVTSIGKFAFNDTGLTAITVEEANTQYSNDEYGVLFNKEKTQLIQYPSANERKSYIIPDGVATIIEESFSYCNLESVTLPESITCIEKNVFIYYMDWPYLLERVYYEGDLASWCSIKFDSNPASLAGNLYVKGNLVSGELVIPEGVTAISNSAFSGINNIESVLVPDSVKTIGDSAFFASSLRSVEIPDSVTYIGENAFARCRKLERVVIGNGIIRITEGAFSGCKALKEITIPLSVTGIANKASGFNGGYFSSYNSWWNDDTDKDTVVYYEGTEEMWDEVLIASNNGNLTGATVYFEGAVPIPKPAYSSGDPNGDDKINSSDALMVLQCAVGSIELDEQSFIAADVNKDSKVNSSDALKILQFAVGTITEF